MIIRPYLLVDIDVFVKRSLFDIPFISSLVGARVAHQVKVVVGPGSGAGAGAWLIHSRIVLALRRLVSEDKIVLVEFGTLIISRHGLSAILVFSVALIDDALVTDAVLLDESVERRL